MHCQGKIQNVFAHSKWFDQSIIGRASTAAYNAQFKTYDECSKLESQAYNRYRLELRKLAKNYWE